MICVKDVIEIKVFFFTWITFMNSDNPYIKGEELKQCFTVSHTSASWADNLKT